MRVAEENALAPRADPREMPLTREALEGGRGADRDGSHGGVSAVDYAFVVRHAPLVVDTRNATRDVLEGREKILKA